MELSAMKVILREDVDHVGKMGDLVTVKDGYARNYLLPRDMAAPATERNVRALEHQKRLIETKRKKERAAAEELVKRLASIPLTFPMQAGEDDKLFGSVTSKDIADALAAKDFAVDRRKIVLEKPIKALGTFTIPIKFSSEITGQVSVSVVKQESA
jgi:large subunit ribosomal protein L9